MNAGRGSAGSIGNVADEALRMHGVGRLEDRGLLELDLLGLAVMHRGWRVVADFAVPMLVVVPLEERAAERSRLFQRAEALRELRAVT